jgi:hypothetical protein
MCDEQIGDKLPISEFKMEEMVSHPSIVMVAKRGSGKSWVTKAMIHQYQDIPVGVIIAPTERQNCFFANIFPNSYIYYAYESSVINTLLIRQKMIIKKRREKRKKGKTIDCRAIVVMDDCLASKGSWAKDQPIMELLFNGRHVEIMYILTMQYPLGLGPELRSNFDYVFLLAEDSASNLKRLHEHYASMFPDLQTFRQVFKQLTRNYGAMVIKNRGARESILDKIAFYRAPNLDDEKLRFGCKQFNKYHDKNYDRSWESKELERDYDEYLLEKRKSKSQIKVHKIFNEVKQK